LAAPSPSRPAAAEPFGDARGRAAATHASAGNNLWIHGALLVGTLLTTVWAGALHQGVNLLARPAEWSLGLPYALALLSVLGVHEMGHYVVARRRGVKVSLPYFVPAPFWLGTFGAFIKMEGPIEDRSAYFDVGIAGPLAGLVVALAALFFGLSLGEPAMAHGSGLVPASSFLLAWVYSLAGGADPRAAIQIGPIAFAGWLGFLITALNLLPVGQLDGGHLSYALFGPAWARRLSVGVVVALVVGGYFLGSHLLMWGFLVWLIAGTKHPRAVSETRPVGPGRWALGAFSLLLLLSILLPLPA